MTVFAVLGFIFLFFAVIALFSMMIWKIESWVFLRSIRPYFKKKKEGGEMPGTKEK